MKAICQNHFENIDNICEYYVYETEFEVESIDNGKCPKCNGSKIAPAWIKQYRIADENDLKKEMQELFERKKSLDTKISKMKVL